jgi:SAM-dependent methyltransferase
MENINIAQFEDTVLASDDYMQERLAPQFGDHLYLHLTDLLFYMQTVKVAKGAKILDFGAGGSPYRDFFPESIYLRADISDGNSPDYLIPSNGKVDEEDNFFDVIISTQVAEHISNYQEYFAECFRLLKPNGKLILTVPGMYEEHGCPDDFQRWMTEGIRRDVEKAGFEVEKITKLTVGPRAVFFFFDRYLDKMQMSRKTFTGIFHFSVRLILKPFRGIIHRIVDKLYSEYRMVETRGEGHAFYLGLAVEASKK